MELDWIQIGYGAAIATSVIGVAAMIVLVVSWFTKSCSCVIEKK